MTISKFDDSEERIKAENKVIAEKATVPKNLKKKPVSSKKKLKYDLLEVRASSAQRIVKDGTSIKKKVSKYDMPYAPSIKSLPCTSFSDASLLLNLKNKAAHKPGHKSSKRILKLIQNNKDIIRKLSKEGQLFGDVDNYEQTIENSTDVDNFNTLTNFDNLEFISGDSPQVRTTTIEHSYSTKIIESSQTTDSIMFASQLSNSYLSKELAMKFSTSQLKTHLQRALDGPFNNKIIKHNNITQPLEHKYKSFDNDDYKNHLKTKPNRNKTEYSKKERIVIHKEPSYEHCKPRNVKKQTILVLFDCNKYPLTDSQGKILKTAGGKNLVKYKNGKPYDCFGRDVFDSNGNSSSSPNFKPFSNVWKKKKIVSALPLYDFRGYCLLNYDGSSLINADGKDLIQVDKDGKILYDLNNHPIFDKNGIPVTKQNGLWLLPKGIPIRIFDKTKHPLTNKHGDPLLDIKFRELLKTDQHGRPLLDSFGNTVFDAAGVCAMDLKFNPSLKSPNSNLILIAILENKPAQLYDKRGWPLTEKTGEVMNDSSGHCLLMLKKVYPNEITDFDQLLFRLNEPVPLTEICLYLPETKIKPEGVEVNKNNQSEILDRRKINLDFVGHPLSDRFKCKVFDKEGRKIFLNIKSYFVGITDDPSSTTVCISDDSFTIKTSHPKTHTQVNRQENISSNIISFQTETDLFGRPLYDSLNRPLFDKYGRPIYDLFGRLIYDYKGRPIASAVAKRLDNGSDESPGINLGFKTSCLIPQDPNNLPKITDLNGGPLFDSLGYPLYNQKGKPLIDAYGRPLYDENGIPQCDKEGRPVSKIVKQRNMTIVNVEDKIEMLQLSPIGNQIKNPHSDGEITKYETIKETAKSCINEAFKTSKIMKNFISRIRITTFSNGEKYFEILESVPFS